MNINDKLYCKLMYVTSRKYPDNLSLLKLGYQSVSNFTKKIVYVEEYDNFDSLIARINNIFERVIEGYKKQNRDADSEQCSFNISAKSLLR